MRHSSELPAPQAPSNSPRTESPAEDERLERAARAHALLDNFRNALETAVAIRDPFLRGQTLHTIAARESDTGNFDNALLAIDRIDPTVYGRSRPLAYLALAQARAGRTKEAALTAEQIGSGDVRNATLQELQLLK